jgi:Uma2 family endonuclease
VIALRAHASLRERGRKFANYRRIPTLQEYLLIDAQQINIELFRRNDRGKWELNSYSAEEEVHLKSVDFRCAIESIYEDVQFYEIE